jgi:hypothetical protein
VLQETSWPGLSRRPPCTTQVRPSTVVVYEGWMEARMLLRSSDLGAELDHTLQLVHACQAKSV